MKNVYLQRQISLLQQHFYTRSHYIAVGKEYLTNNQIMLHEPNQHSPVYNV